MRSWNASPQLGCSGGSAGLALTVFLGGLWNPLIQSVPRTGKVVATWLLAEGRGTSDTTREGARQEGLASDPAPRRACPFLPPGPSPAPPWPRPPGSLLTLALRVWDGWGSESPRGREGSAESQAPAVFSVPLPALPPLKSQLRRVSGALAVAGWPSASRADRKSRCYRRGQDGSAAHTRGRAPSRRWGEPRNRSNDNRRDKTERWHGGLAGGRLGPRPRESRQAMCLSCSGGPCWAGAVLPSAGGAGAWRRVHHPGEAACLLLLPRPPRWGVASDRCRPSAPDPRAGGLRPAVYGGGGPWGETWAPP